MKTKTRPPSLCKDTLEDTWNLAKQEPLHQHKDATAQFRNKSDFFGR